MTEDYLRRQLPPTFPVTYMKLKKEAFQDLKENCENICIKDFLGNDLKREEVSCLQTCFKKSLEFDAYVSHEYERLFIDEVKKFNRKDGV